MEHSTIHKGIDRAEDLTCLRRSLGICCSLLGGDSQNGLGAHQGVTAGHFRKSRSPYLMKNGLNGVIVKRRDQ